MKKLQLIVFSIVFSSSSVVYAATSLIIGGPTPLQSYESASSSSSGNSRGKKNDDAAAQLAKVQAIMAKSKKDVQEGKVKPLSTAKIPAVGAVTTPAKKIPTPPATTTVKPIASMSGVANSEVKSELESQMNQLNQATIQYQQQTNRRIEGIQSKLQNLTKAMLLINQQLSSMSTTHGTHPVPLPKATKADQPISFDGIVKYLAFAIVGLLAVMLGFLISRQKKENS